MCIIENGNGKLDFIKKQIGEAITKAKNSDCADGHEELVEVSVLSVRLGEMVLDEMVDFKSTVKQDMLDMRAIFKVDMQTMQETLAGFVEQRKFIQNLWKLSAGFIGSTGLLGTVWLVIQIVRDMAK